MNVYRSGGRYVVDNDRRSGSSFQTNIHIYTYVNKEALYLTV